MKFKGSWPWLANIWGIVATELPTVSQAGDTAPARGKLPVLLLRLRGWTNLLESPCLCLLPQEPLLVLLLLQELHLEQLLLREDPADQGRLHHRARAPLQQVGQGLLRVAWHKGACWAQPGTT